MKNTKGLRGKERIEKEKPPAKYVNWMLPVTWVQINAVAQSVGKPWSPREIARRLKQINPEVFSRLGHQRISKWKDGTVTSKLVWKASTLEAVKRGSEPGGKLTRVGIMVRIVESEIQSGTHQEKTDQLPRGNHRNHHPFTNSTPSISGPQYHHHTWNYGWNHSVPSA